MEKAGFQTLLVGGAVRDLLLGRKPKDFDLATQARPEQVNRLFRNSRVIGRRFRLVHLRYPDMTVEVATFRAKPASRGQGPVHRDNTYGTPEEDMERRDFSVNALAFDLEQFTVVDYVGGLVDLEARLIRTLVPPEVSFAEDPVRMLRAIRFQVRLGFTLEKETKKTLLAMANKLVGVSRHRLAEETQRFLSAGQAVDVFDGLEKAGLLKPLLGLEVMEGFISRTLPEDLDIYLESLDDWVKAGGEPIPPTVSLLGLLIVLAKENWVESFMARDPGTEKKLKRDLPPFLAAWGLLNGQVVPAVQILAAGRMLLERPEWAENRRIKTLSGIREAWFLLILLEKYLGLDPDWVAAGKKALSSLPVLPILDHHKRNGKSKSGKKRGHKSWKKRPGKSGKAH